MCVWSGDLCVVLCERVKPPFCGQCSYLACLRCHYVVVLQSVGWPHCGWLTSLSIFMLLVLALLPLTLAEQLYTISCVLVHSVHIPWNSGTLKRWRGLLDYLTTVSGSNHFCTLNSTIPYIQSTQLTFSMYMYSKWPRLSWSKQFSVSLFNNSIVMLRVSMKNRLPHHCVCMCNSLPINGNLRMPTSSVSYIYLD